MDKIILTGWNPGMNKVGLAKLLRDGCGLSLSDAKTKVDDILDGQIVEIERYPEKNSEEMLKKIMDLGAKCRLDRSDE